MKWARNQYATMISILGHDNVGTTFSVPIVAPIERGLCNELHARVRDVTIGYPDTIFVHGILTCVHKLFLLPLIIVILIHLNK
jgi:hypothetical protein